MILVLAVGYVEYLAFRKVVGILQENKWLRVDFVLEKQVDFFSQKVCRAWLVSSYGLLQDHALIGLLAIAIEMDTNTTSLT